MIRARQVRRVYNRITAVGITISAAFFAVAIFTPILNADTLAYLADGAFIGIMLAVAGLYWDKP